MNKYGLASAVKLRRAIYTENIDYRKCDFRNSEVHSTNKNLESLCIFTLVNEAISIGAS